MCAAAIELTSTLMWVLGLRWSQAVELLYREPFRQPVISDDQLDLGILVEAVDCLLDQGLPLRISPRLHLPCEIYDQTLPGKERWRKRADLLSALRWKKRTEVKLDS